MRVLVYGLGGGAIGGVKNYLFSMRENMTENCIFDFVIDDTECKRAEDIARLGGKLYFVPIRRKIFKNIAAWRELLSQWKEVGNTVYFNISSLNYIVPILLAKKRGYRVVLHAHNNDLHDCSFLLKFLHYFNRFLIKKMDFVRLTNSSLSSDFMFGKGVESTLIYNAIDIDHFKFSESIRRSVRQEYRLKDSDRVYGFVGRIDYQKNPLFLMDVFYEVTKRNKNAVLLIVGDGNMDQQVRDKVRDLELSDRVIFAGAVLDAAKYYQAMDLFLLPSRFEGLGIVLVEAQCAGLPCITSADVVPKMAQVSEDLLHFVSLDQPSEIWARESEKLAEIPVDRNQSFEYVRQAGFDITEEALKLERILVAK